ncbi:MAG TPA: uracil-DNA glycosylase [Candidatus Margulisiibacteriota bacterium]|nr:uracil-DNA glycosylase [Candidatus Margulisiibacteriota bacterium]
MNRTTETEAAQAGAREVLDQVRAYLEYQRSAGLDAVPRRPRPPATAQGGQQPPAPPASSPTATQAPAPAVRAAAADLFAAPGVRRALTLDELRAELGDCQRCKLCRGRTHIVFGVGNPQATLMFVGEGPGRDEDLQAEPFVGRAGQLLTEIITKGMKLRREDVYIANVIKCRPPENRNPEPDEIAACQPFLLRQIEIIQPKVLVALGTFAAQTLLGLKTPISRLRGHWYDFQGIRLMPTLHPAYLLRNPNDKRLVWEDIKTVLRELERYT